MFIWREPTPSDALIPGGDAGALRLTALSIAISMLALLAAEFLARRLSRILPGT